LSLILYIDKVIVYEGLKPTPTKTNESITQNLPSGLLEADLRIWILTGTIPHKWLLTNCPITNSSSLSCIG